MKILHVINTLDPSHGGPAVSAPSLASAQAKNGHFVSIAFFCSSEQHEGVEKTKKNIPYLGEVKLIKIPKTGIKDRIFAYSAIKTLFDEIRKVDIVHLHGVWDPILVLSAIIALTFKIPYTNPNIFLY